MIRFKQADSIEDCEVIEQLAHTIWREHYIPYRRRKIGAAAMHFVEEQAKRYGLKTITLTVNKNNHKAIDAYLRLGFDNLGSVVAQIGNGFVMDDFKMAKTL